MTIHHATIKRATKLGIELTETEAGFIEGKLIKGDRTFNHSNVNVVINALVLSSRFAVEYPNLHVGGKSTENTTITVFQRPSDDAKPVPLFDLDGLNMSKRDEEDAFAKALEAATEQDLDTGETDELPSGGTVVSDKYRNLYKERGNENHCGDWLAEFLDGMFDVEIEGKKSFDAEAFAHFLVTNGVEMVGKWAALLNSNQNGWKGRFRMNGRQKLEVAVAIRGTIELGAETIELPEGELEYLRNKHAVAIAKHEKRLKALAQAEKEDEEANTA